MHVACGGHIKHTALPRFWKSNAVHGGGEYLVLLSTFSGLLWIIRAR